MSGGTSTSASATALTLLPLVFGTPPPIGAQWQGELAMEGRTFATAVESLARTEPTLIAGLRRRFESDGDQFALAASLRIDPTNPKRNRLDIDELAWTGSAGAWDLSIGIRDVFWGVLESQHLVDVVNQHDPSERWPRRDKLGQPMLSVARALPWGGVEAFVLAGFRRRPFAGRRGRLWSNAELSDVTRYEVEGVARHLAWATRGSVTAGAWDVGVSAFRGTSRDPLFEALHPGDVTQLVQIYNRTTQVGLDVQYTGSPWLWKMELVTADPAQRHFAAGSGVEYAAAGFFPLVVELFYDSRGSEATTSAEHDLFLGSRLPYQDGIVSGGATVDLVTGNTIVSLEITRRFGSNLVLSFQARAFLGDEATEPVQAMREESNVALAIRSFF